MKSPMSTPDLSKIADILPPIIMRSEIEKYLPGLFSKGHLQNIDSQNKGPRRLRVGGGTGTGYARVGYIREDFLEWLASKIRYDSHPPEQE